jgi:hypothetical protein
MIILDAAQTINLDISQAFTIGFCSIGTLIMSIILFMVKSFLKRQEEASKERERKQELHFKKLDATVYSIGFVLDDEKGQLFKKTYEAQMEEYYREKRFVSNKN